MLIYVKQLIWETSESSSIKDPATFIFFCLHERDSTDARASVCVPTHDHPFNSVCESVCVHLSVCEIVFGQLVLALSNTAIYLSGVAVI